jgi:tetratricopeptide (TPR) repeat protein
LDHENNFLENIEMKGWRQILWLSLCLTGVLGLVPGAIGEETGFKKYRENVLKRIEEMKTALATDPSDARAHFQLGLSYMALGRHREEIAEYLEAVRLEPDFVDAHFNLGLAYDLLEDGAFAIRHMLRARQIYSARRNHRGIRTSQRYLRTFESKYGFEAQGGRLNSASPDRRPADQ